MPLPTLLQLHDFSARGTALSTYEMTFRKNRFSSCVVTFERGAVALNFLSSPDSYRHVALIQAEAQRRIVTGLNSLHTTGNTARLKMTSKSHVAVR